MKAKDCIIVDKETIEVAISQLREQQRGLEIFNKAQRAYYEGSIAALTGILNEAQPLTPVLEKAWQESSDAIFGNIQWDIQEIDEEAVEQTKQDFLNKTDL